VTKKLFAKCPEKVVNVISSLKKVVQAGNVEYNSNTPPETTEKNNELQCSSSSEENEEIVSFSSQDDASYQPTTPSPTQSTSVSTVASV